VVQQAPPRPKSILPLSKIWPHPEAVSWFKSRAKEHVEKVRELAALLEHHGIPTRMIQTDLPGYIVYEDDYQVAAVPFRRGGA
jgi:hypothetical protein